MDKLLAKIILGLMVAVLGIVGYNYYTNQRTVSKQEFNEAHLILNQKIDSLEQISRRIESKVDSVGIITKSIKMSIDSLKKGQEVIYNEVKKNEYSLFKDLLQWN